LAQHAHCQHMQTEHATVPLPYFLTGVSAVADETRESFCILLVHAHVLYPSAECLLCQITQLSGKTAAYSPLHCDPLTTVNSLV